ncbi:MAG: hypothetical protein GY754_13675 [bacterium]|nr:hypothetical protein [bacterium]
MGSQKDLKQYELGYLDTYSTELVADIGKKMDIPVDVNKIDEAGERGSFPVCVFNDPEDARCFIILDRNPGDIMDGVVVRCGLEKHEKIKEALTQWNIKMREENEQEIVYDMDDMLENKDSSFNFIKKKYKLDLKKFGIEE